MRKFNVLILEDNPNDAELLELALSDAGLHFRSDRASNKKQFTEKIKGGVKPDIILSDFSLPDINGIEAKSIMKDLGIEIPFILITGVLDQGSVLSVLRSGISDMVLKSRLEEVPAAVLRTLRESAQRTARLAKENEHRAVLENIGDIIIKLDADHVISYASPSLEFQLQWKPKMVVGKKIDMLVADSNPDEWLGFVEQAVAGTYSKSKQIMLLSADGERLWAAISLSNHLKTEGLNCYLLTAKIIDEQVKTRAELEQINDYLPGAVYRFRVTKGGQQQLEYISKGISNVTGFGPDEYEDDFLKVILKNVHEKDHTRFMSSMLLSVQERVPFKIEFRGLHMDGSRPWFYINATPHVESSGDTVFIGMITDISREKEAEIKANEIGNKLESVVSAAQVGIWEYDLVSDKFTVNDILANKLGYKLVELQEMDFHEYSGFIHPDDIDRVQKNIQEYVTGDSDTLGNEYRLRSKDGKWRWFSARGAIVKRSIKGKPLQLMGTLTDITELKSQEQNLSTVFELSPMPKILFDPHSLNIKMVNKAALNMYDFTETEFLKKSINHLAGNNLAALWRNVNHVMKHGEGKFNSIHRAKDNKLIEVFVSATKIKLNHEEQILIAVLDETEKREAERELEKLSLVASKATNGVVITDKDQIIEWVNDGFTRISGYSAEELIGKRPKDILQGPETSESSRAILREAVEQGKEAYAEIINYHKEHGAYWVEVYLTPIRDTDGNVIKFMAIQNDITARKKQETELRKLSTAMDQSPVAVVITGTDGQINYVNPKFETVTGYRREEVLGKNPNILKSGHTSKEDYHDLWETISSGKVWAGEMLNKRKDKSLFWERASIGPIIDNEGKITDYVAVKEDITELKVMQDQLKKALSETEKEVELRTAELKKSTDALAAVNSDFMSSLSYAKRLQEAIIPSDAELRNHVSSVFTINRPRDVISGDFYWCYKFDDQVIIAMVDCTGHGVPGALMSMAGHEQLESIVVSRRIIRPEVILEEMDISMRHLLNRRSARTNMNDGMDMSVIRIDRTDKVVTYAGAKGFGLMIKDGQPIELMPDRLSVGGDSSNIKEFSRFRTEYKKGDRIYLYTDGFYDQFGGPENKKLYRKQLNKWLIEDSKLSFKEHGVKLEQRFDDWRGNEGQIDDVTLIGLEF